MSRTSEVIAELERTLKAMKAYQIGQGGRTIMEWEPVTKTHIEKPDAWPYVDMNHSAAMRASMDLTKALAAWRKAGKPSRGPK